VSELRVNVDTIGRNTEAVASLLRGCGVKLVGVTKGCLGEPAVGAAMLAGGAVALADTRDLNLARLRAALPGAELHRIHLPSLSEPSFQADVCYVSSAAGAAAAAALGPAGAPASGSGPGPGARDRRRIMIQVDTGDQREGVPAEQLLELAAAIVADERLTLEGVGTNYACFKGEAYGIDSSVEGVAIAARTLRAAGYEFPRVSGGNSSVLWHLKPGELLPAEVTELRCGEALLLGQDALFYEPLRGCRRDACILRAEVLERYTRPVPEGTAERLVLGIGRQDVSCAPVTFLERGLYEVGRSADYLVVEVADGFEGPAVGSMIEMLPTYEALVAAWTSPYVRVEIQDR
jgi:ornithine racemase